MTATAIASKATVERNIEAGRTKNVLPVFACKKTSGESFADGKDNILPRLSEICPYSS
ncbi:hypothetical protein [Anaerocaecibacter muris]|uniref:hypothetical protein n=1 Tax=Anaerocaecibacter muris TaxID=2941513 RepID=UPI003F68DDF2